MGKMVHIGKNSIKVQEIDDTQKDTLKRDETEYVSMSLDEFVNSFEITPEQEEKFARELFKLIKEECKSNWNLKKIFREIFKK